MNTKQKHEIISKFIGTAGGRQKLASSMIAPLRSQRDYASVGRKAFFVEQLPDGALPIYDKDPEVTAYVIGEEGENIVSVSKSKRVSFPLFEIASNPEIPLTEIKQRRFDLIERSVDKAKSEINQQEDTKVFGILDALEADPTNPNPTINVAGRLTSHALADAFANVTRHDLRVATIFMNAKDYSDLLKWDRDVLDPNTQESLLKTGLMARLWGANIIVSRVVPAGTVYVCAESEFFGRIPVRTELTILSADDPKNRMIGFSIFQQIGIGAYNPLALQVLKITR